MNAKVEQNPSLELPHTLREAVRAGRAILFLGAGASKECSNSKGERSPDGEQLRDILAQRFFGKPMKSHNLMSVAEMAIAAGMGESLVFDEVAKALEGFETSEAHRMVCDFNWRLIATTRLR